MVDIATVSVIASASVAGLTIVANLVGGERQRRHEADLDFESRVWERKSEALFRVIERCTGFVDSDAQMTLGVSEAFWLSKLLDDLFDDLGQVEALASEECRVEMRGLLRALRDGGVKHKIGREMDEVYRYPIERGDDPLTSPFARNVQYRMDRTAALRERALDGFEPDIPALQARAARLIEKARASVRRSSD